MTPFLFTLLFLPVTGVYRPPPDQANKIPPEGSDALKTLIFAERNDHKTQAEKICATDQQERRRDGGNADTGGDGDRRKRVYVLQDNKELKTLYPEIFINRSFF